MPGCWSIRTAADLYALEGAWRELSADTESRSPFHTWEFGLEWFQQFVLGAAGGATGSVHVAVAVDEHRRVIGLAPMFEEGALGQRALGLILQPFGRSHSMETMTDEPVVLLRRGHEDRAAAMLVSHLATQAGSATWDMAILPHPGRMPAGAPVLSVSPRLDFAQVARPVGSPLILSLPPSFEQFRATLSKSMRDNIAYYPRRISRELGQWSVELVRSPDQVAVATDELIDLHRQRSRWSSGLHHRNHIEGEREATFLRRWFQRLAVREEVCLARLIIDGQVAAVQAFVQRGGSLAVYYSGHGEAWRRYSPLTVIMTEVLRDAVRRGIQRVVFAPGADAWKTRWGATPGGPSEETSIYKTGLGPLLRGVLRRLRSTAGASV